MEDYAENTTGSNIANSVLKVMLEVVRGTIV